MYNFILELEDIIFMKVIVLYIFEIEILKVLFYWFVYFGDNIFLSLFMLLSKYKFQ